VKEILLEAGSENVKLFLLQADKIFFLLFYACQSQKGALDLRFKFIEKRIGLEVRAISKRVRNRGWGDPFTILSMSRVTLVRIELR
jgi:hypothetical protein